MAIARLSMKVGKAGKAGPHAAYIAREGEYAHRREKGEALEACEAGNQRNGYRERKLTTSVGTINLRIPKLRAGSYFPEDLIERYSRADRAVIAAVPGSAPTIGSPSSSRHR